MKRNIISGLAVICAVFASWWAGHLVGERKALGLNRGTFAVSLAAAEALREGHQDDAQTKLDTLVTSSALLLIEDAYWSQQFAVEVLRPSLISYRRKFRSEAQAWTPAESTLEALLNQK
jgi:hypothetical protein